VLTEAKGIPVATILSGANRHDMKMLGALLDGLVIKPEPGVRSNLTMDRGYDYELCRTAATERGYIPHIPPRGTAERPVPAPADPDRHPPRRWVVEAAHSWFNRHRRLLIRWEHKAAHYLGFVQLAAVLIIYRKIRHARLLSG
jgi:putative transposase